MGFLRTDRAARRGDARRRCLDKQREARRMARKDYELIAAAIKRQRDATTTMRMLARADKLETLDDLAHDLAGELTRTNPSFDQRRFLEACGCEI